MMIIRDKHLLKNHLTACRAAGKTVGFVPTMGALHKGHIALVERALKENDIGVVSIFVNPTQFTNADDLKNYPRTFESDKALLIDAGTDVLFYPSVEEMYPENEAENENYDFEGYENVMEGKYRPGHFKGVAQIVSRFFEIVQPDRAYFGEKDFQQLVIIRELVKKMHSSVRIIGCPTIREADGLAMSSRNALLKESDRKKAAGISSALFFVRDSFGNLPVNDVKQRAVKQIETSTGGKVEYLEIADEERLQPAEQWNASVPLRVFTAVKLGNVRLIDNIPLN